MGDYPPDGGIAMGNLPQARRVFRILLLAVSVVPGLAACTKVAGTGRSQLNFMSLGQEASLGDEAYADALAGKKIVRDGPDAERVRRIGANLADAARHLHPEVARDFAWEFTLVDEPQTVNAWALPGGKCAVYTGLLPVADTDDRLAVVMGHEVAHAIARHGAERMSQAMAVEIALAGAGAGLSMSSMSPAAQQATMAALGVGTEVGVALPYSRLQENEADQVGLMLSAEAGYDPRQAIELWRRMEAAGGAGPPEFLSTHPSNSTRIERLERLMPEAMRRWEARIAR
jgi:predicted Zn-dependent protease